MFPKDAPIRQMNKHDPMLDELRARYEAAQGSANGPGNAERFAAIDAPMRKASRWLELAITYLNGLKPPIGHRFDLGYGYVFESPRFRHGSVRKRERSIAGVPVLEAIDVHYEIAASKPLVIDVVPGWIPFATRTLDAHGLRYTGRRLQGADGALRKCIFSVSPVIPARISFRIDHQRALVTVALTNVDRLERVTLEFPCAGIAEPALGDLVRLILGRGSAFLLRAPLAGLRGRGPDISAARNDELSIA